jgi:hypothetical protein
MFKFSSRKARILMRMRYLSSVAVVAALVAFAISCGSSEPRTPAAPLWDEGFAADKETQSANETATAHDAAPSADGWVPIEAVEGANSPAAAAAAEDPYAEGWVEDLSTRIDDNGKHIAPLPPPRRPAAENYVNRAVESDLAFAAHLAIGDKAPATPAGIRPTDFAPAPLATTSCVVTEPAMVSPPPADIGVDAFSELESLNLVVDQSCEQLRRAEEKISGLERGQEELKKDVQEVAARGDRLERKISIIADGLEKAKESLSGLVAKSDVDAKRIGELEAQVADLKTRPVAAPMPVATVSSAPGSTVTNSDLASQVRRAWEGRNEARIRNLLRATRISKPHLSRDELLALATSGSSDDNLKAWVNEALARI